MNKGKNQIIQLLNRNIIANVTMMRAVQIACYLSSVLVLVGSIWNLMRSELNGAEMVFGLLLCILGPLVFLGIAVLLPLLMARESEE
jgi:hypothetical protein